jgi:hypothetical protein
MLASTLCKVIHVLATSACTYGISVHAYALVVGLHALVCKHASSTLAACEIGLPLVNCPSRCVSNNGACQQASKRYS